MAVFAPSDLKKMRVAHGMSAADLAELVNCDSTTITRYETGKLKPNPDTMYMICEACDEVDKWCDWMRTEYPISYARVHPDIPQLTFEGKLLTVFAEIDDVKQLQVEAMRDGADGVFRQYAQLLGQRCGQACRRVHEAGGPDCQP